MAVGGDGWPQLPDLEVSVSALLTSPRLFSTPSSPVGTPLASSRPLSPSQQQQRQQQQNVQMKVLSMR